MKVPVHEAERKDMEDRKKMFESERKREQTVDCEEEEEEDEAAGLAEGA